MTLFQIIQLIVEGLVLVLLLYVAFLKSYFQEKGKNLATREDVQEITELVETVKSQLEYSLHAKLSLRNLERQSLVDYFSKYHVWQSAILDFGSACTSEEQLSNLEEARNQLQLLKTEYDLSTGKMELFVENADISEQSSTLRLETAKLSHHAVHLSFEMQKQYLEYAGRNLQTPPHKQTEAFKTLLAEQREHFQTFLTEQKKMFEKLYPLILTHRSTIAKHLKEMTLE